MKYISIILYLLIVTAKAQSVNDNFIEIQIINDSLQTFSDKPELTISLRCKNDSDKNLLLYGFGGSNVLKVGADRLCANQDRISGGIGLLIFNEKHERVYAVLSIHNDSTAYKPMTREKLEERMNQNRLKYLTETKVIEGGSILDFDKTIDLHEFPLRKGTYFLQVIGFAGKSLKTKLVGEEQIEKDKKANNAELYQGCAISNEITFRVD
jgi:hypothetical protein